MNIISFTNIKITDRFEIPFDYLSQTWSVCSSLFPMCQTHQCGSNDACGPVPEGLEWKLGFRREEGGQMIGSLAAWSGQASSLYPTGCCCCKVASVMSDSVRPHRWQRTRMPRPWDSPGKHTGVGCHFLLQCMKVKSESEVAQSCPTLCNPMDCSLPGSSAHGIFQAGVLEWGVIAFSDWLQC